MFEMRCFLQQEKERNIFFSTEPALYRWIYAVLYMQFYRSVITLMALREAVKIDEKKNIYDTILTSAFSATWSGTSILQSILCASRHFLRFHRFENFLFSHYFITT